MKHIIKTSQFSKAKLNEIFKLADKAPLCRDQLSGKILATVFYEESTRTRLSFQSAIAKLGGHYIDAQIPNSSVRKGESLYDTLKVISYYADVIALRHPQFVHEELSNFPIPIINAGAGSFEHPTQALTDLYTLLKEKGRVGNNILIYGDTKKARTIHSFMKIIKIYDNTIKFKLIDSIKNDISVSEWYEFIRAADIMYITRIQYDRHKFKQLVLPKFVFGKKELSLMKDDAVILHPLPRRNELSDIEIDKDRRALYFKQVENGVYIRMALLLLLLRNSKV